MSQGERRAGWDVDRAQCPQSFVEYLQSNSESALMRRTIEARLQAHDVASCHSVLDVGCGIGTHARMLAEAAAPRACVTGVDLSETMLHTARRNAGERVRFVRADAHHLPFDDSRFDLAWLERALVHMGDPRTVLRDVRRVLGEGGRALVGEADYRGVLLDCGDEATWHEVRSRWLSRLRQPEAGRRLRGWLADAGFSRIELYPELRTFDGPAWVDRALGLRRRSDELVAEGSLDGEAVQSLWDDLQARHEAGRFFMAIPFVVASATR